MSLRDEFAAAALPSLIALRNDLGPEVARGLAILAYTYADAMLEMRNRCTLHGPWIGDHCLLCEAAALAVRRAP